ncbi:hypothetical protein RvY_13265 [Ramazzottius varieornatus]|uniref:Sterol regulatory element-binding protein cleavage-activating protein n=1 Tax=Ramazzottius varieornatus TaxID=947166 RepID=A0A1D1VSN3_RAMVA|nr:hypothetical protein RvY_13265 [Ramazzottius varieornatus]
MDSVRRTLQKLRVAITRYYYIHGIFCASHPYSIICIATTIVVLCCIPLTKLPLPGYGPLEYATPITEFAVPVNKQAISSRDGVNAAGKSLPVNTSTTDSPEWLTVQPKPECFVQQILVTAQVLPWTSDLLPVDSIRRPLGIAFDVLDEIDKFTSFDETNRKVSLQSFCYEANHVLSAYKKYGFLVEDGCLVISPTNIWDSDIQKFRADSDILGTVFAHEKRTTIDSTPGFKDLAFGVSWSETGIKPQILTAESRSVRFAITVILKEYNKHLMKALAARLHSRFGIRHASKTVEHVVHIRFQNLPEIVQFLPLIVTYLVVLLYLCFSVSKLEMVKSKVGLAFSAVIAIVASLIMSAGLCSYFGLQTTLSGGEIFPYLVVIIGLENVIVITKSVVSTPVQLDVKYRIAQGLSREGWSITKNFLAELMVLLLGYLTDVPAIREFCTFGLIGLLSDMFLQLLFFSAVLSIDIGRMELADHLSNRPLVSTGTTEITKNQTVLTTYPEVRCPIMAWISRAPPLPPSAPSNTLSRIPDQQTSTPATKVPRRVRILWYFGSRRVMQRGLMALTLLWIVALAYQSAYMLKAVHVGKAWTADKVMKPKVDVGRGEHNTHKLSYRHWPTLFGYYNVSLVGKYISVLPPIPLSVVVSPAEAVAHRHPLDHKKTPWKEEAFIGRHQQYLTAKLQQQDRWVLIALGGSSAVAVLGLCLYALRLIWPVKQRLHSSLSARESSDRSVAERPFQYDVRVCTLEGHLVGIRNMAIHEDRVATSCHAGQIRMWDWNEGKEIGLVKRLREHHREVPLKGRNGTTLRDFVFVEGTEVSALALNEHFVVAGCTDGLIEIYASQSRNAVCSIGLPSQGPVTAVTLKDAHIFCGNERGDVCVFSKIEHERDGFSLRQPVSTVVEGRSNPVEKIVMVEDIMVVLTKDAVKVMSVSHLTVLHSLWSPSGSVTASFFDKISKTTCAGYSNGKAALWNSLTGSMVNEYSGQLSVPVRAVCFSENFVVAVYLVKTDMQVWRWCRAGSLSASTIRLRSDDVGELYIQDDFLLVGVVGEIRVYDCMSMVLSTTIPLCDGTPQVYLACPGRFVTTNGCDLICDYGRQLKIVKLSNTSKSR